MDGLSERRPVGRLTRSGPSHHRPYQFCGCSLHAGHDVGVLAECEAWAFVTEALANDLDWHVGAERDRGMSMSQVVQPNSGSARVLHLLLEQLREAVRVDGASVSCGHDEITVAVSSSGVLPVAFLPSLMSEQLLQRSGVKVDYARLV